MRITINQRTTNVTKWRNHCTKPLENVESKHQEQRWDRVALFKCTGYMGLENFSCLKMLILLEKRQFPWSHSFVFTLEKQLSNLNFQSFLSLKCPLVATLKETLASTSRKYVSKPGNCIPDWAEKLQFFWLHSSILDLEGQPKDLNFQSFWTYKIPFGATFKETCSLTSGKYLSEPSKEILDWSKKFRVFWWNSSVHALEKQQ